VLGERFITEWAVRLRSTADPPAVAVLLRGSHARGAGTACSDVDFDVLVAAGPTQSYPAYLVEHDGRLVHVSVAVCDVDSWLHRMARPARWAYGLAVAAPARLLWVADERWRRRITRDLTASGGDAWLVTHPAADPELEDLVADLGKVASAYAQGDHLGLRPPAAEVARLCPTVLRLVNPPVAVASRRAALEAVLAFPVAPHGYRDAMLMCGGFEPAGPAEVLAAAHRLVSGVVELLSPYAESFVPEVGPDFAAALADGRLARYVDQLAAANRRGVNQLVDALDRLTDR
jgi:phosphoribosyl-AMP cyclohydrolase